MKLIDLSHTIETGMTTYPGTPGPKLIRIATHNTNGYAELHLTLTTHTGTHLDAPFHMLEHGQKITDLAVDRFFGKAVVVKPSGESFTVGDVKPALEKGADFVLLFTGMQKHWNTDDYFGDYPVLTLEAARLLASSEIKGVGIDAISIDKPDASEFVLHKTLLSAGLVIIENLTGLDALPDGELFTLAVFPLKIKDGDGSPVRAVAILD